MRLIDADKIKWDIGTVWPDVGTRVVPYSDIERAEIVDAIPIKWIKEWNIEHWESANDADDMMVDRMMEEWWQKNVDDQEWDDPWEQHLSFERWMKEV